MQGAADTIDGATLVGAHRDKADTYSEPAHDDARHRFLVLVPGDCIDLVRKLGNTKARALSATSSGLIKLIYFRRWWGILPMATQRAVVSHLL